MVAAVTTQITLLAPEKGCRLWLVGGARMDEWAREFMAKVEPWARNDWDPLVPDQEEKELAAYLGPNGETTLIGLDTHGRLLNNVSADSAQYSVGGLPANTTFNLALWNASGDGRNTVGGRVTTNDAGVARFEVPLQAAFALTTVTVS